MLVGEVVEGENVGVTDGKDGFIVEGVTDGYFKDDPSTLTITNIPISRKIFKMLILSRLSYLNK